MIDKLCSPAERFYLRINILPLNPYPLQQASRALYFVAERSSSSPSHSGPVAFAHGSTPLVSDGSRRGPLPSSRVLQLDGSFTNAVWIACRCLGCPQRRDSSNQISPGVASDRLTSILAVFLEDTVSNIDRSYRCVWLALRASHAEGLTQVSFSMTWSVRESSRLRGRHGPS